MRGKELFRTFFPSHSLNTQIQLQIPFFTSHKFSLSLSLSLSVRVSLTHSLTLSHSLSPCRSPLSFSSVLLSLLPTNDTLSLFLFRTCSLRELLSLSLLFLRFALSNSLSINELFFSCEHARKRYKKSENSPFFHYLSRLLSLSIFSLSLPHSRIMLFPSNVSNIVFQ